MRNTKTFFALLLTASLVSCKKDESNKPSSGQEVGEWNLIGNTCGNCKTVTAAAGDTYTITFTVEGKDFDTTMDLRDDGTFTSEGSYSQVITTNFEGIEDVTEVEYDNLFGEGTYELDGDQITLKDGSESITLKVDELTDSKMVLIHEVNRVESAAGNSITNTGTYYYTFEK